MAPQQNGHKKTAHKYTWYKTIVLALLCSNISSEIIYPHKDVLSVSNWHIFNSTDAKSKPLNSSKYFYSAIAQGIRESWGLSYISTNFSAYQSLEFDRAIDLIHQNQNPTDCLKASYLLSEGYSTGFGSEFHVEGFGLALALEMGRVYLPARTRFAEKAWQTPASLCGDVKTLLCYFKPWSKCTYEHVDKIMNSNSQVKIRNIRYNQSDIEHFKSTGRLSLSAINSRSSERIIRTILPAEFAFHKLIPKQLELLIDKRIPSAWRHYWWRAVSAAYLTQPNSKTQQLIKKYSAPGLRELGGDCVSMYVRHGDKGREMTLQPFQAFGEAAEVVWQTLNTSGLPPKKTMFIGTETLQVLSDAKAYASANGWELIYNPLQDNVFDSHPVSKLEDFKKKKDKVAPAPILSSVKDLEYLLMIVNLADIMQCNAYVCTLMSNYCRLIDELRAVVAAKPHAAFADLSKETCGRPPCIGKNVVSFDW